MIYIQYEGSAPFRLNFRPNLQAMWSEPKEGKAEERARRRALTKELVKKHGGGVKQFKTEAQAQAYLDSLAIPSEVIVTISERVGDIAF